MILYIYGLRLKGDTEVRYVGQTADMQRRLAGHFTTAKQMPWATRFATWLRENADNIEIVQLDTEETRSRACVAERAAVTFCLALNHRLFNQWLVPSDKRIAPRSHPASVWATGAAA